MDYRFPWGRSDWFRARWSMNRLAGVTAGEGGAHSIFDAVAA